MYDTDLTNDQLKQLHELLDKSIALSEEVMEAEDRVKRLKARKWKLDSESIPAMMEAMGMTRMDYRGRSVRVEIDYTARIPKHLREEAFDWLEANGHGGLIKVFEERKVHHQTLNAWAKERFEAGDAGAVPDHLFNLWAGQKVRIK